MRLTSRNNCVTHTITILCLFIHYIAYLKKREEIKNFCDKNCSGKLFIHHFFLRFINKFGSRSLSLKFNTDTGSNSQAILYPNMIKIILSSPKSKNFVADTIIQRAHPPTTHNSKLTGNP